MAKKDAAYYEKMATQPIPSLLIALSIPSIISMLVTNIYNMADTAFVGQLGTSASGAVGIVFGFMSIIQATGFMFGQGAGSIISRKLGQKDNEEATRVASTGFFWALGLGGILALFSFLFLDKLVFLLGSTETIAPYAKTYIGYILIAAPVMVTCFTMNQILRYEGKASLGMVGMMVGALLNIAMDPILMFGFHMGIAGAGLSTCISQYISFFVLIYMFLSGKTQSRIRISMVSVNLPKVFDIASTGFPSMLRQILNSFATVVMNSQAAVYGDAAVAAMSIVSRIIFFVFAISLGIGQGFQPISGFSYGAKKYSRLREAYRTAMIFSEGAIIIIATIVLLFAGSAIQIFRNDPAVIEIGTRALRLQLLSEYVLPACTVTEMMFQSTGRKMSATILSSLRSGVIFIPLIFILSSVRGLAGVQEAQPLSVVLSTIPAAILAAQYFRKLPKTDGENASI